MRVCHANKSGRGKDEKPQDQALDSLLFHVEAVGQKIDVREGYRDVGGSKRKEGKGDSHAHDAWALYLFSQRFDRSPSVLYCLDEAVGPFRRHDTEDEELPDEVDDEGNGHAEEDGMAHLSHIAVHVIVQRGDDDLKGEGRKEDWQCDPDLAPHGTSKQGDVHVIVRKKDEEQVGKHQARDEEHVHAIDRLRAKVNDGRKEEHVDEHRSLV